MQSGDEQWPLALLSGAPAMPPGRRAYTRAPSTATPNTWPTWRNALCTAETIPAREGPTADMATAVIGAATTSTATGPDVAAAGVTTQLIADEPLAVVVPAGDPLAAREQIAVAELRDRPLICLPPGSGLRACLEQACAEAGFRPYVAFEATDPRMLVQLAAAGLGAAVLSESGARRSEPGASRSQSDPRRRAGNLRTLRLSGTTARARLLLAWRDDAAASPAARALTRHARESLPDPPPGN